MSHGCAFCFRSRDSSSPWKCNICGGHFRSIDGVLETTKVVTCAKCRHRVCRNRCSSRERLNEGWVCQLCQRNTESWFKGILSAIQPNSKRGSRVFSIIFKLMVIIYTYYYDKCIKIAGDLLHLKICDKYEYLNSKWRAS